MLVFLSVVNTKVMTPVKEMKAARERAARETGSGVGCLSAQAAWRPGFRKLAWTPGYSSPCEASDLC